MFLNAMDVQLMILDRNAMLRGPDACELKLVYHEKAFPLETPVLDPVFNERRVQVNPSPKEFPFRAIHHTVKPTNYDLLKLGFLQAGDAIFYFSTALDLQTPQTNSVVIPGSLMVKDGRDCLWAPIPISAEDKAHLMRMSYNNERVWQALACRIKAD